MSISSTRYELGVPHGGGVCAIGAAACTVVEGRITNFVPMPYEGHADENFAVSGVQFSYSDYGVSDAFNNTSSHGGPIKAGSRGYPAILCLRLPDFLDGHTGSRSDTRVLRRAHGRDLSHKRLFFSEKAIDFTHGDVGSRGTQRVQEERGPSRRQRWDNCVESIGTHWEI